MSSITPRQDRQRTVARYSQVCYLDPTRLEAHVVDITSMWAPWKTATRQRVVRTLYSFAPKAVIKSTIQSQKLISDALEKRGYGRWSTGMGCGVHLVASDLSIAAVLDRRLASSRVGPDGDGYRALLGRNIQLLPALWPGPRRRDADREAARLEPLRVLVAAAGLRDHEPRRSPP